MAQKTASRVRIPQVVKALAFTWLMTAVAMAQGSAPVAQGDHLVAPEALAKLLPSPDGWTRGAVVMNQVDVAACRYTMATVTYSKGDMRVKLTVADTGAHEDSLLALVSMVVVLPEGYSDKVTPATTIARVKIDGMPAAEMWDAEALRGEIAVLVGGRFAVALDAKKADSLDTLRRLVSAVDLKALGALK